MHICVCMFLPSVKDKTRKNKIKIRITENKRRKLDKRKKSDIEVPPSEVARFPAPNGKDTESVTIKRFYSQY